MSNNCMFNNFRNFALLHSTYSIFFPTLGIVGPLNSRHCSWYVVVSFCISMMTNDLEFLLFTDHSYFLECLSKSLAIWNHYFLIFEGNCSLFWNKRKSFWNIKNFFPQCDLPINFINNILQGVFKLLWIPIYQISL